jgi:hypothetical protein
MQTARRRELASRLLAGYVTGLAAAAEATAAALAKTGSARGDVRGHSVETELVALDVLHHNARIVAVVQ